MKDFTLILKMHLKGLEMIYIIKSTLTLITEIRITNLRTSLILPLFTRW